MPYVILVHLLYLLTSILEFNKIQASYINLVKAGLQGFMSKIKVMLLKSSIYLYELINNLIKLFCNGINYIFNKIKTKLLFLLIHLELQIDFDMIQLSEDLKSFKELLSELQTHLVKYIQILETAELLFKGLTELIKDNIKFKGRITNFYNTRKSIEKVKHMFYYKNHRISDIVESLSTIKLQKSIELTPDKNSEIVVNLKMNLENIQEKSKEVITMGIDKPFFLKFKSCACSIKNILDMIDMSDVVVSKEIMSIIEELYIVEIINLPKLLVLIRQTQLLYLRIFIRGYLLLCTILFYAEVIVNVLDLFGLMKFDCCNACEFLSSCSLLEKNIKSVSSKIHECIKNLATSCNTCKSCIFRPKLIKLYFTIIKIIILLKFYVDLMALEILIFKDIINNLILMSVSSAILEGLIKVISENITSIDKAIPTLIVSDAYLRAFYTIQLQNTLVIFGLSNALRFSQYIHENYKVLLFNLDLINRLIWAIECYINHLIVFKFTSVGLNFLIKDIQGLGNIIDQIKNVAISTTKLIDKLNLVNKSIEQLKTVSDSVNIKNWKESAAKIRHETQLISGDIEQINSQINLIIGYLGSIYKSFGKLIGIYYSLLVLIYYVYNEIKNNNDPKVLGTGLGNEYYTGVVMSVLEPCNKQLKFILGYLLVMWVNLFKLIKFVETAMVLIIVKVEWLKLTTEDIKSNVDKINKGVEDMECAIEGVASNFIRCSLFSIINTTDI